ncbi:MAG TPA: hypothetical protein GXZ29_12060, partial [Clostridiales bacterium]|nr:hypothetical protein [Clostridiales bacterium]
AALTDGPQGEKALAFNGVDNYINIGTVFQPKNAYTMMAWVKQTPNPPDWQAIVNRGNSWLTANTFGFKVKGSQIYHGLAVGSSNSTFKEVSKSNVVVPGEWNHIALTRQGETVKFYVDGELVHTAAVPGQDFAETDFPMYIGIDCDRNGIPYSVHAFKGALDDVRLYDRALPVEEIKAAYNEIIPTLLSEILAKLESARQIAGFLFTDESYAALKLLLEELDGVDLAALEISELTDISNKLTSSIDGLVLKNEHHGLTAYYNMNEKEGERVFNGLPGAYATFVNGDYLRIGTPFGKGLYMNENRESHLLVPGPLPGKQDDFTIDFWIKSQLISDEDLEAAGKQVLLSNSENTLVLSLQDNMPILEISNGTVGKTIASGIEIAFETVTGGEVRQAWNHIVVRKEEDTFSLYLNGEAAGSDELENVELGDMLTLGAQLGGEGSIQHQYNGLVDELYIYDKALSDERIMEKYESIPFRKSEVTNIAYNKTLFSDPMDDAYRLNDGKVLDMAMKDTPWSARGSGLISDKGLKYGIDLGAVYEINALSITHFYRNYKNPQLRRFRDVVIQISPYSDFSNHVTTVLNTDTGNRFEQGIGTDPTFYSFVLGYDIMLEEPVLGRYVRLINSGFYNHDGAYSAYSNVVELEVYGIEPSQLPEVDKSELESLISHAGEYDENQYTPESWSAFMAALSAAEEVLADEEASQEEVDNALEALKSAIEGLMEIETREPEEPEMPEEPEEPKEPGGKDKESPKTGDKGRYLWIYAVNLLLTALFIVFYALQKKRRAA